MEMVDSLSRPHRLLVYEHGAIKVAALIDSGMTKPMELRDTLRGIRAVKQEQQLLIDVWTPETVARFFEAFKRGLTRMNRRRRRRRD